MIKWPLLYRSRLRMYRKYPRNLKQIFGNIQQYVDRRAIQQPEICILMQLPLKIERRLCNNKSHLHCFSLSLLLCIMPNKHVLINSWMLGMLILGCSSYAMKTKQILQKQKLKTKRFFLSSHICCRTFPRRKLLFVAYKNGEEFI